MSKRSRGSARVHRRPGARPPTNRPAGFRPARPRPVDESTALAPIDQESQALDEAIAAEEMAAERPAANARQAVRTTGARQRAKPGSLLAARAATEYVYVGQDLRRIAVVSVVLLATMIAAWLLIVVLQVIPLDFY